jgi:hypothetical protein
VRRALSNLALIMGVACCPASVQAQPTATCDAITDVQERAAVAAAANFVAKTWVENGPDWFAAYDSKAVPRNPFAVSKDISGGVAVHGYVWARDVACNYSRGADAAHATVTYAAGALRFKEGKTGWTKPLQDSVLVALDLSFDDENWSVVDKSPERSVLMPENILRRPEQPELPKPASWPDKRCQAPKHWEGKTCVVQSAPAASK